MRYLYASLAAAALAAAALPAAAGTLLVPQQFSTIQAALNAAKPYDTVLVSAKPKSAVYSEALTLATPHVTLQGKGNPVLDGAALTTVVTPFPTIPSFTENSSPSGIQVEADFVSVSGLTVQNFGRSPGYYIQTVSGIAVGYLSPSGQSGDGFKNITISGVTLRSNNVGITISGYDGAATPTQKGYFLLGNLVTGSSADGIDLSYGPALISGNKVLSNGGAGISVSGTGLTLTGNESGSNGGDGIDVTDAFGTYDPTVTAPDSPNPAPTVTTLNSIHDNAGYGMEVQGTQYILGNSLVNNTGVGVNLDYADYSTISGNVISGTVYGYGGGVGIQAEYSEAYSAASGYYGAGDSKLNISFNQISGGVGDGIFFYETAGGTISANSVTGNQGVGIHLSDYTSDYGYNDFAPTTVTGNRALHNTLFDARDDTSAADNLYEPSNGGYFYGDGMATNNVWTKNLFGTTDPVGLSK